MDFQSRLLGVYFVLVILFPIIYADLVHAGPSSTFTTYYNTSSALSSTITAPPGTCTPCLAVAGVVVYNFEGAQTLNCTTGTVFETISAISGMTTTSTSNQTANSSDCLIPGPFFAEPGSTAGQATVIPGGFISDGFTLWDCAQSLNGPD